MFTILFKMTNDRTSKCIHLSCTLARHSLLFLCLFDDEPSQAIFLSSMDLKPFLYIYHNMKYTYSELYIGILLKIHIGFNRCFHINWLKRLVFNNIKFQIGYFSHTFIACICTYSSCIYKSVFFGASLHKPYIISYTKRCITLQFVLKFGVNEILRAEWFW